MGMRRGPGQGPGRHKNAHEKSPKQGVNRALAKYSPSAATTRGMHADLPTVRAFADADRAVTAMCGEPHLPGARVLEAGDARRKRAPLHEA